MTDPTTTEPTCVDCGRTLTGTALAACERCIERGRRLVLDVLDDMARFSHTMLEVIGLRGIRYDVSAVRSSDDDSRLPFGMDRFTDDPENPAGELAGARTPQAATDILLDWAQTWIATRGDVVAHPTLTYLADVTPWAIQNQDASRWPEYAQAARAVRSTVRRILGITPVRENTPCPSCGGRLVREWQPRATLDTPKRESSHVRRRIGIKYEGLDDTVRCTRCHHSWPSAGHVHTAALAALEVAAAARPEAIVTLGQASKLYAKRVPSPTMRSWILRGVLVPVVEDSMRHGPWRPGDVDTTTLRFVLADVEALVLRREQLLAEAAERKALAEAEAAEQDDEAEARHVSRERITSV
ncbi:MAG: hypothetical protein FWF90_11460 [Promicromonosporaceae bacterium]|nr:hypothetical protein [Promicromonosporaceae bacterium]